MYYYLHEWKPNINVELNVQQIKIHIYKRKDLIGNMELFFFTYIANMSNKFK